MIDDHYDKKNEGYNGRDVGYNCLLFHVNFEIKESTKGSKNQKNEAKYCFHDINK